MMRAIILLALLLLASCSTPPAGTEVVVPIPSVSQTQEVVLQTLTGQIHGTLLVPSGESPKPVALIIAGSGPTDRNGNTKGLPGSNDSLKMLAESLAANGIASLRYDTRGIAASGGAAAAEADLRFDHYVEDAAAWVRQLKSDSRFSTVTVIGHSEGSLIGMIAARTAEADGYVSIAGAGRSAPEILRAQLKPQLPPELWLESERILNGLIEGKVSGSVPPSLAALYRESVQPYLISWFAYDPAAEVARLEMPVLLVQGTTDIQVSEEDVGMLRRAAPSAEVAIIEGMNHVLKIVDADRGRQVASYSDPSLPIARELEDRIVAFIRRL